MSKSHKPITPFAQSLHEAIETLQALGELEPAVTAAAETVLASLKGGGKLLFCGNGGSAADSAHIATEFTCRFMGDRRPYPAIALAADGGLLTAIGNDYSFQDIFSRQVRAYGRREDVLIALTSSGKSRNILSAIEEARRIGLKTISFLGKGGGFTKGAADIEILVPGTLTARIQEAHKFLLHVLCELVEPGLEKE
ncbi:MAG: SIS domain-containing protein [Terrimicrobiaceae bacterium]|jgi:D-sedoheptulose 7-phosphate isomerase|nr:SIS domain-containing protein [Terrimicrobiaceae bacterium]